MRGQRTRKFWTGRLAVIAAVAVLAMLAATPAMGAQSSAVNQYKPNLGNNVGALENGNEGVAAGAQQGNGGNLPFTGYPMTSLVWIIAGLLAGGIALRVVAPRLDRRRI